MTRPFAYPRLARPALWLALIVVGLLAACSDRAEGPSPLRLQGSTMGTYWSVQVAMPPRTLREAELRADIEARLAEINAQMSTYEPSSELSRFNDSEPGDWFPVSPELATTAAAAAEVSLQSGGAFDVTVGPLVDLWGFGAGSAAGAGAQVPDDAAVQGALAAIGHEHLQVRTDPPALRKDRPLEVDLSAIAKGFAVDALAHLLDGRGATDYLVDIGGELRARGANAQGQAWRIGIEVPDPETRGVAREAIALRDLAVATSGDYRNFFESDGQRYSHTIDPLTGRPVVHDVASVTVIHPQAMMADALATAMNVLGSERGLVLADEQGLAVLFILYDGDGLAEAASAEFERLRATGTRAGAIEASEP